MCENSSVFPCTWTILLNNFFRNYITKFVSLVLFLCVFRPGSVEVTNQLIFENQTIVPDETETEEAFIECLDKSIVFLNVVRSSILACEYHVLFLKIVYACLFVGTKCSKKYHIPCKRVCSNYAEMYNTLKTSIIY